MHPFCPRNTTQRLFIVYHPLCFVRAGLSLFFGFPEGFFPQSFLPLVSPSIPARTQNHHLSSCETLPVVYSFTITSHSPEEGHPSPKVLGKYCFSQKLLTGELSTAHGYLCASRRSRRLRGQEPLSPKYPVGSAATPPFGGSATLHPSGCDQDWVGQGCSPI